MTRARDLADLLTGGQTITTADNTTQLTLSSTDADASVGPVLDLVRDSGSPADSDLLGSIKFIADDDGGNATTFASVSTQIGDASDGTESSALQIKAMSAGSLVSRADFLVSETVFNNGSIDLDFRVESNGNANMLVVDAGNDRVGIATASPAYPLDVTGSTNVAAFRSSASNSLVHLPNSGSSGGDNSVSIASVNDDFYIRAGDAERMRIASDGDLGVGTSSPQARVDIRTAALGTALQLSDDTNYGVNMLGVSGGFRMKMNGAQTLTIDQTDNANVFHINGSGNLGIGHTSPTQKLHVSGNAIVSGIARLGDGSASSPAYQFVSDTNTGMFNAASDTLGFSAGGNERMRLSSTGKLDIGSVGASGGTAGEIAFGGVGGSIDGFRIRNTEGNYLELSAVSSGNSAVLTNTGVFLVGKTSDSIANNGISLAGSATGGGFLSVTNDGNACATFNRKSSSGDIITFSEDGSKVGAIGSNSGQSYFFTANDAGCGIAYGSDNAFPSNGSGALSDNSKDLGGGATRWDDVFATNGTIQTSDENEKQDIASLTSAEITAAKAISKLFKTFKWKDKVVAKGDAARTHTGVVAQQVQKAMYDAGLDATKYAFWCSNTWTNDDGNEQTRMGVRYPELLAFIGAATEQRLADIEKRLTALEE